MTYLTDPWEPWLGGRLRAGQLAFTSVIGGLRAAAAGPRERLAAAAVRGAPLDHGRRGVRAGLAAGPRVRPALRLDQAAEAIGGASSWRVAARREVFGGPVTAARAARPSRPVGAPASGSGMATGGNAS
jgi:hypothetical protein